MTRIALIIGGTGQIGIATGAELIRRGWTVILTHTGRNSPQNIPTGSNLTILDRKDSSALEAALGSGVDALIDTVAFNAADADQLIGLRHRYGALCVISSASVYEDGEGRSLETAGTLGYPQFDGSRAEDDRAVPAGPNSYSSAKVALEKRLLDVPRPVSIIRPCAIHGINAKHPREWWFVKRMLDDRRQIPLAGNGVSLFHTTATANLAALVATVVEDPAQRILNCGDPVAPSVREIGEIFAAALGWSGSFLDLPMDSPIGQTPWSTPYPFTVAMDAANALGYRPAGTYAETIRPYLDWMVSHRDDWQTAFPVFAHYPTSPFDYEAEDAAL